MVIYCKKSIFGSSSRILWIFKWSWNDNNESVFYQIHISTWCIKNKNGFKQPRSELFANQKIASQNQMYVFVIGAILFFDVSNRIGLLSRYVDQWTEEYYARQFIFGYKRSTRLLNNAYKSTNKASFELAIEGIKSWDSQIRTCGFKGVLVKHFQTIVKILFKLTMKHPLMSPFRHTLVKGENTLGSLKFWILWLIFSKKNYFRFFEYISIFEINIRRQFFGYFFFHFLNFEPAT